MNKKEEISYSSGYSEKPKADESQAELLVIKGVPQLCAVAEMPQKLLEAIKNLKERDRLILTMYYFEDLSFSEIANIMDMGLKNVVGIYRQIIKQLNKATASL